jgi:hypothetical protein
MSTIEASEVVILHVRAGSEVGSREALVLSVDPNPSNTGTRGEPALEVVAVNLDELKHAGTSDFHAALDRRINVVHISHSDYVTGRVNVGYELVGIYPLTPAEPADLEELVPGELTASGKRWREIHAEYSQKAQEQYLKEFPESAPPASVPEQTASAAPIPAAVEPAPVAPIEAPLLYAIFLNSVQKGDAVIGATNVANANGEMVALSDVEEGDVLEGGFTVQKIQKSDDGTVVNIIAITAV